MVTGETHCSPSQEVLILPLCGSYVCASKSLEPLVPCTIGTVNQFYHTGSPLIWLAKLKEMVWDMTKNFEKVTEDMKQSNCWTKTQNNPYHWKTRLLQPKPIYVSLSNKLTPIFDIEQIMILLNLSFIALFCFKYLQTHQVKSSFNKNQKAEELFEEIKQIIVFSNKRIPHMNFLLRE